MTDSRRRQPGPSRIGSTLVLVGCLGVLGLTFMVGFYSGRYWTRASLPAASPDAPPIVASTPPARRGATAVATSPALTFYEELTAPLAVSPAPARITPSEPRRPVERADSVPARPDDRTARSDKRGADAPARAEPVTAAPRFTVQVAAYSAKTSAEALRNTMTASGHAAYIVESEGPPGAPRYRVRVGSYPSREAAIAAAARLPVPGARYVTTR